MPEENELLDKLDKIFLRQFAFQTELGYEFSKMSSQERSEYIKEYALHLDHEMHEMLAELPYFKSWKRYPEPHDYTKAKEEFIDAFHFFLNCAIALGFSTQELYDMFMGKNDVNHDRQENTDAYKRCVE